MPAAVTYLEAIRVPEFPSPTTRPDRVAKTTRAELERQVRSGWPSGHASLLFYMGSDKGYDYFYVAHHTFGRFYGVPDVEYPALERMPLTDNSLAWRAMPVPSAPLTTESAPAATNPSP